MGTKMAAFAGVMFFLLVLRTTLIAAILTPCRENASSCTEEALNPYEGDCRKYVVCVRNKDGSFSGAISECPIGEAFDKNTRACVPENQVSCDSYRGRRVARAASSLAPSQAPLPPASSSPTTSSDSCNNKPFSCIDCKILRICRETSSGNYQKLLDVDCTDGKKEAYCDDDTTSCTDKIPRSCASPYPCTGEGIFPDATNCTMYHFCYDNSGDLQSETDYCATGQVFSSLQKMCVTRRTSTDCHTAKCPVNGTLVTSFAGEPSYYVVCIKGIPEFVYYCGDYKEFNLAEKKCKVACKKVERIPDSSSCSKYYECTAKLGGGFTATSKSCPKNYHFDKESRECIKGSC